MSEESGYYGNQNALKDKGRQRDTNLNIRVNSGDKAAWELANVIKLSSFS